MDQRSSMQPVSLARPTDTSDDVSIAADVDLVAVSRHRRRLDFPEGLFDDHPRFVFANFEIGVEEEQTPVAG